MRTRFQSLTRRSWRLTPGSGVRATSEPSRSWRQPTSLRSLPSSSFQRGTPSEETHSPRVAHECLLIPKEARAGPAAAPADSCAGRFAAKAAICAAYIVSGSARTTQATPSVQGGVVREPTSCSATTHCGPAAALRGRSRQGPGATPSQGWAERAPDLCKSLVLPTLRKEDSDHHNRSVPTAGHEVHVEGHPDPVDQVLTSVMEMKLLQFAAHAVEDDAVAGLRAHLNRAPRVLHPDGGRPPARVGPRCASEYPQGSQGMILALSDGSSGGWLGSRAILTRRRASDPFNALPARVRAVRPDALRHSGQGIEPNLAALLGFKDMPDAKLDDLEVVSRSPKWRPDPSRRAADFSATKTTARPTLP